jgi:hypothetical protein
MAVVKGFTKKIDVLGIQVIHLLLSNIKLVNSNKEVSLVLDFLQSYNIIYQSISLLSWLLTFIKTNCQIILHKIGVVCISATALSTK